MKFVFLFLFGFASISTFAQSCAIENTSFKYGERIDYTIYYHLAGVWVGAGEVFFKVDSMNLKGQDFYHFNSEGKTFKKYDWVYKVRDQYETYMNVATMKPLRFKRSVNEGGTHIREDYVFNYKEEKAYTLRQMEEDEPYVKDTVQLDDCSYDVMSMIYVARNLDYSNLKKGDKIPIEIFLDNESHDSYIEYLGKENLKIKNVGEFRCIVFSPLLIEGTIFNAGDGMTVYVTDDQNRVPLLIETPILVGSIKARVNGMSGLRFPLSSKIAD
jgi:hypothetical protein